MEIKKCTKIRIWKDKWLPTSSTFKIQSPVSILDVTDAKVQELLAEDGKVWNSNLILETFWTNEAITILSIPISQRRGEDKLIWGLTNKDTFTIRSAYFAAMQLNKANLGEPSNWR